MYSEMLVHFTDLEATLGRLQAIADQFEGQSRKSVVRENRSYNGVAFSVRCLESIEELPKHSQYSMNKATRKALKDIFTKDELRSQAPTGVGRRPGMDEERIKAVRGNLFKIITKYFICTSNSFVQVFNYCTQVL